MTERELREALRGATDPAARERGWRVVRAAYAAYSPPRRRRWRLTAVAALVVITAGAAVATAATRELPRFVQTVLGIGEPQTRAALVSLPGGGRLLVHDESAAWVVGPDGSRRWLGAFDGASWSPRGRFVVAWRGRTLTAVTPNGGTRWSLSRPAPIAAARWSTGDGYRIAYVSDAARPRAAELRIVNGDGTGDRRYGSALARVAPAWRPHAAHVVAYVDAARRVRVVAVDASRRLWRTGPIADPLALAWSADGRRLAVLSGDRVRVYDGAGRRVASRLLTGVQAAAWSPRGRLAVVRARAGTTELLLLDAARGLSERLLFSAPGRFGTPAWSPDGGSLLLPWVDGGQWLFLNPGRSGRPLAIANIAQQFSPGAADPRFPGTVAWCCVPS